MTARKIKLLQVTFENPISPWELPAFRGAVIATAGRQHILFHNHIDEGFIYSYPKIQYKQIAGKPMLMSIDQGIDEIHHFFENMQLGLMLGERPYELKIEKLNLNQFTLQVWDKLWEYRIDNWLALNQKNHEEYQKLESLSERLQFLERTLKGNILSFAKGVEWTVQDEIRLYIKNMREPRLISFKGKKLLGFSVDFACNVFFPAYIGLGKGVSQGYGIVKQRREKLNSDL